MIAVASREAAACLSLRVPPLRSEHCAVIGAIGREKRGKAQQQQWGDAPSLQAKKGELRTKPVAETK